MMIYDQLPTGHKQLFIMKHADHMVFAGEAVDPDRFSRDLEIRPGEQASKWSRISEMSLVFWQHYLSDSVEQTEENRTMFKTRMTHSLGIGDVLKFG